MSEYRDEHEEEPEPEEEEEEQDAQTAEAAAAKARRDAEEAAARRIAQAERAKARMLAAAPALVHDACGLVIWRVPSGGDAETVPFEAWYETLASVLPEAVHDADTVLKTVCPGRVKMCVGVARMFEEPARYLSRVARPVLEAPHHVVRASDRSAPLLRRAYVLVPPGAGTEEHTLGLAYVAPSNKAARLSAGGFVALAGVRDDASGVTTYMVPAQTFPLYRENEARLAYVLKHDNRIDVALFFPGVLPEDTGLRLEFSRLCALPTEVFDHNVKPDPPAAPAQVPPTAAVSLKRAAPPASVRGETVPPPSKALKHTYAAGTGAAAGSAAVGKAHVAAGSEPLADTRFFTNALDAQWGLASTPENVRALLRCWAGSPSYSAIPGLAIDNENTLRELAYTEQGKAKLNAAVTVLKAVMPQMFVSPSNGVEK